MLNFIEKIEQDKILQLLSRSLPYYLKSWNEVDKRSGIFGSLDPKHFNMRSVGSSSPVIEYVLRPHLNILCILSSYLYLDKLEMVGEGVSEEELKDKLIKGLRWACNTHLTGSRDEDVFLERKRWGENWRSSLWASVLGLISVFAKNTIDTVTQDKIKLIVSFEADRFTDVRPPSGCEVDTKVEENAQDAMILAWAINLCPEHRNVKNWENSLRLWAVNIASSIQDKSDHSEYFDNSIASAVTTQNLFPDFTAENHGFFHPEVLSYGMWIILATCAYELNGNERPSYLHRKSHQKTFEILLRFCLPSGMIFAPGGHDMPMFIPRPLALAWGVWRNDPRALHLTAKLLNWMNTNLYADHNTQGPWVFGFEQNYEGWELLFQSQTGLELALLASLPFPKEQRTFSAGQVENAINTRHIYPYIQVCYRRNVRTTRSMAWKALGNHPLVGLNVHSQTELIAPFKAALLGIPTVSDPIKSWKVLHHQDRFQRDGFDTSGLVAYYNNAGTKIISREIRVITWGDEGLIVLDRITPEKDLQVQEQYLSPVYLVNDYWTGNNLELTSGSLKESFSAYQRKFREVPCPAFWASIENHLLFQFVWKQNKGLYYLPGGERNAPPYWKNCRLDMMAIHVDPIDAKEGEPFYEVGFFIGSGKGPRPFKTSGISQHFFKGLVIMDGKITVGLD
ncbi:hypothetical protein CHISP_0975 [Chitinispirillum alkaliphilum]|nr:hypothetical protein CHISP_0975 [Chitinispirillum alkaliphilum]